MNEIRIEDDIVIWIKKNAFNSPKEYVLNEALRVIENSPLEFFTLDAYPYLTLFDEDNLGSKMRLQSALDTVLQIAVEECKKIYGKETNKVNIETWVNRVQSKNPVQSNYRYETDENIDKYHNHVKISKAKDFFLPDLTFVYYIQMPENLKGEDGVLYFKGKKTGEEYYIRPEEKDLIIMEGDVDHAPNNAPHSNIDRIVFAGNIGF